jgi:hypothetical protein
MTMPALRPRTTSRRWPMTAAAWSALVDELVRLRGDLAVLTGASAPDEGVVHLPIAEAARRLDVLSAVLAPAQRVHVPDRAVIGRRVTLREADGDTVTYAPVFPGDGDPVQGWISADPPLGAALIGRGTGETVAVDAPVGRREVTVLSVD